MKVVYEESSVSGEVLRDLVNALVNKCNLPNGYGEWKSASTHISFENGHEVYVVKNLNAANAESATTNFEENNHEQALSNINIRNRSSKGLSYKNRNSELNVDIDTNAPVDKPEERYGSSEIGAKANVVEKTERTERKGVDQINELQHVPGISNELDPKVAYNAQSIFIANAVSQNFQKQASQANSIPEKISRTQSQKTNISSNVTQKQYRVPKRGVSGIGSHKRTESKKPCRNKYSRRKRRNFGNNLNVQQQKDRSAWKHQCKLCLKKFQFLCSLRIHMLVHLKLKEFECDVCAKQYHTKYGLSVHLNTHKRNPRFVCRLCNKICLSQYQLESHIRYHTGERPFKCKDCGDAFINKGHMDWHMKWSHPNRVKKHSKLAINEEDMLAWKHQCKICPQKFIFPSQLRIHILNSHGTFATSKIKNIKSDM